MVLSMPFMLPRNLPITRREAMENTTAEAATTTQPRRFVVVENLLNAALSAEATQRQFITSVPASPTKYVEPPAEPLMDLMSLLFLRSL